MSKEALAEQPAQQEQDGPINEGWKITVAHGHSGYGVYAHMEDYPEEGAVLVQAIKQPAQQVLEHAPCQGMNCGITRTDQEHSMECQAEHAAAIAWGTFVKPTQQQEPLTGGDERRHIICLCPDCTKPAQPSKPLVGLTPDEIMKWWRSENGLEDCNMCRLVDFITVVYAIEAKLKEKNT